MSLKRDSRTLRAAISEIEHTRKTQSDSCIHYNASAVKWLTTANKRMAHKSPDARLINENLTVQTKFYKR